MEDGGIPFKFTMIVVLTFHLISIFYLFSFVSVSLVIWSLCGRIDGEVTVNEDGACGAVVAPVYLCFTFVRITARTSSSPLSQGDSI